MGDGIRGQDGVVRAAGALVWRDGDDGRVEVLVVHRPRYLDWTFPKGKWEPGDEDDEACARREVEEETGFTGELGRELPSTSYRDGKHRPKRVRYWELHRRAGEFVPNSEVDEIRWLPASAARSLLTYPYDRVVLDAFAASPPVTPASSTP
jgi:8-oxo-dGTP diphosphatase